MKRFQNHRFNRVLTVFLGLIYGQLSFADGGLIPTINGAQDIADGNKDAINVAAGWVKTGLFILLATASVYLLVKSMNTVMLGLKKAQEEDGSITTMLNYLVSAVFAVGFGLVCAYLGYLIYQNFNV
ncbi:TPA: hypothetical protein ACWM1T_001806 [Legionella pneumophila]|nr:hypothetical protein [Legionella pneumophila]HBD7283622.1 hypothetical protein [Legionella pneumophila]HBD9439224.1 hypothetical protein [Legionella pneumophila]HEN8241141.1 hypothetical protein [Legionella pneumophila]